MGEKCGESGGELALSDILAPIDPPVHPNLSLRLANMSESDGYEMNRLSYAQRHGALLNQRGGYYQVLVRE